MTEDWQKWEKGFRGLEEFRRLNPDRWPGPKTRFPGPRSRAGLGAWCARQQREYKRDNLNRVRLQKLLDLGFPILTEKSQWEQREVYSYHERGWLLRFQDLRTYRKRHPDAWPKWDDADLRIRRLYGWMRRNRSLNLRPEFKSLLKTLDFNFSKQVSWERQFRHLQAFKKQHPNRLPMSNEEYPVGNKLGWWISTQRKMKKKGILRPDREEKLRVFDFDEFNQHDFVWEKQFRHLKMFRKKNPNRWPKKMEEYPKGNKLGSWIDVQRRSKRAGSLDAGREKKLKAIGFELDITAQEVLNTVWEGQYRALQAFRKENPNRWPIFKEKYPEGNKLGIWVAHQRQMKKTGNLRPDREEKLRVLDFGFAPGALGSKRAEMWERQFKYLQEFRKKYPKRWPTPKEEYPAGNKLGVWVRLQRRKKRTVNLRLDREEKLRSLDFDFAPGIPGSKRAERWERQFKNLLDFRKKYPKRWPTPKEEYPAGNKLGVWVNKQFQKKKKGILRPDRERKLRSLDSKFGQGVFDSEHAERWERQFKNLQEFRRKYPERWPNQGEEYPEGNKLGIWVVNQRQKKRKGILRLAQEKKLREINFDFGREKKKS